MQIKLILSLLVLGPDIINREKYVKAENPNCVQKRATLNFECTVNDTDGIGATAWMGDSFKCNNTLNQIWLPHPFYISETNGTCGNFFARILSVKGSEFTSRLSFFGDCKQTERLDGTKINCTLSGSLVKIIVINAFPPPPGPLTVTYSSEPSFNVSWSPPSGLVEGGVGGYVFGVTGEGCGCVSMNVSGGTTSVRCSGWTAAGQTCSFEVRTLSQDCGLSSNSSTTAVTLTEPFAKNLLVEPTYRASGIADEIKVTFSSVKTSYRLNVSYMISFMGRTTLQFNNIVCSSDTNHCGLTVNGSQLAPNERYFVVVTASNGSGFGSSTIFPTQISTSIADADIVQLSVDTDSAISCHLLKSYIKTKNAVCSITYGHQPENCDRYNDSSNTTIGQPGVNLTIHLSQKVNIEAEFCYTISLKYGFTMIKIIGSFTECYPSNNVPSNRMVDKMCNCYGLWSQRTQICEEQSFSENTSDIPTSEFNAILFISTISTSSLSLITGVFIGVLGMLGWNKCCSSKSKRSGNKSSARSQIIETSNSLTDNELVYDQLKHTECSCNNQSQEVYSELNVPLNVLSRQIYNNPDEFLQSGKK